MSALTWCNLNAKIALKYKFMYPRCVWQTDRRKQVKNLRGTAAVSALAQFVDENRSLEDTLGRQSCSRIYEARAGILA